MSTIPSDKAIAENLNSAMPRQAKPMLKWFAERFPNDAEAIKHADTDKAFAVGILVSLFQRTRTDCPPISESVALKFISALNGIMLELPSYRVLPSVLAMELFSYMIEEPQSEPLRREIEGGSMDPEFTEYLGKTQPAIQSNWIKRLTPEAALALVVGTQFWWAQRDLLPSNITYTNDPEAFRLSYFINLVKKPKAV